MTYAPVGRARPSTAVTAATLSAALMYFPGGPGEPTGLRAARRAVEVADDARPHRWAPCRADADARAAKADEKGRGPPGAKLSRTGS